MDKLLVFNFYLSLFFQPYVSSLAIVFKSHIGFAYNYINNAELHLVDNGFDLVQFKKVKVNIYLLVQEIVQVNDMITEMK